MATPLPGEVVVTIDCVDGEITVGPDPVRCNRDPRKPPVVNRVRWEATERIQDWRVVFGAYAPVHEVSKMASPGNDTLNLVTNRPEDLGHWKYVVVATCQDGSLKDRDPEMIVEG